MSWTFKDGDKGEVRFLKFVELIRCFLMMKYKRNTLSPFLELGQAGVEELDTP